jgi:phosphinothricin acetyltransferase
VAAYVRDGQQGRGVGRALYAALFELLATQGYCNAYAGIALPNPASIALHQAMGFEPVGVYRSVGYKRGAWRDVSWWSLRLRDYGAEPEEPIRIASLVGSELWVEILERARRLPTGVELDLSA